MFFAHEKSKVEPSALRIYFPATNDKAEKEIFAVRQFLKHSRKQYRNILNGNVDINEPDVIVELSENSRWGIEVTELNYEKYKSDSSDYPALKSMIYECVDRLGLDLSRYYIQFVLTSRKGRNTIGKLLKPNSKDHLGFKNEMMAFVENIVSSSQFAVTQSEFVKTQYFSCTESEYQPLSKYIKGAIAAWPCKPHSEANSKLPQIVFAQEAIVYSQKDLHSNAKKQIESKWKKNYSLKEVSLLIYKLGLKYPPFLYEENTELLRTVIASMEKCPFKNVFYIEFGVNENNRAEQLV